MEGAPRAWWFGGGTDLTPSYVFDEDVKHFHQVSFFHANSCMQFGFNSDSTNPRVSFQLTTIKGSMMLHPTIDDDIWFR